MFSASAQRKAHFCEEKTLKTLLKKLIYNYMKRFNQIKIFKILQYYESLNEQKIAIQNEANNSND